MKIKFFFSYFQVDENYYLFSYTDQFIDVEFFYENLAVIQELDTKERKIRSIRGFLLYVLEIMETGEEVEILNTNLEPFFWTRVKNVLRQSKKNLLIQFLFGKASDNKIINKDLSYALEEMEMKIQNLETQVSYLQERVFDLGVKVLEDKFTDLEIIQSEQQPNIVSEAPKINEKTSLTSQQYNDPEIQTNFGKSKESPE